jgi:hypothetical protein
VIEEFKTARRERLIQLCYFATQKRGEYEIVCRPILTDFQMHTADSLYDIMYNGRNLQKLKS